MTIEPWVSVLFTGLIDRGDGQAGWALEVVSAPEEHEALVDELLLPAGSGLVATVQVR